jgi:hypothetical protein
VFLAWDEDNAFWGPDYPLTMRHEDNVLMRKAMQVPELRDMYYGALAEAFRLADEPTGPAAISWLEHEVRRQSDLVYDALQQDPAKPYTIEAHETARAAMVLFSQNRSRFVSEQMGLAQPARRP